MRLSPSRRVLAFGTAAALSLGLVAEVAGPSAVASSGRTIALRNIAFSPAKLVVSRGTKVTFAFHDGRTKHNVTSVGAKRFKSSPTKGSGTYTVRFTKAGVYRYRCTIHLGMKGSVTVK